MKFKKNRFIHIVLSENGLICEIMWKNVVETGTERNII